MDIAEAQQMIAILAGLVVLAAAVGLQNCDCADPACVAAHKDHRKRAQAATAERLHATYHSPDRPQPECRRCDESRVAVRRDDDPPDAGS